MEAREEPFIHGYKISRDHRWDLFNAYALVTSRLGFKPQRWHLESYPRARTDRFGWTEKRRYYQLHYRHNGAWKRRYLKTADAQKLIRLGITNAHTTDEKHDT